MQIQLQEIIDYLEHLAPLRFQESYDNAGLIYGDPEMPITGAVIALDATKDVILEAKEHNCNLVITHHPIVFRGIKKFDVNYYVDQAVITAIKNDIALYAIHTNLDNVLYHGVNQKIALKLGLKDIEVLRTNEANRLESDYEIGAGALGYLDNAISEKDFLDWLKKKMNTNVVKHTRFLERPVQKIAVCGGAGSFLTHTAIARKADVFISSDIKYHEFFDANDQILLCDIGHYESEFFTIELLHEMISQKFPKFAAHYTKVITNPVFYY